jgi:hypothetical protein
MELETWKEPTMHFVSSFEERGEARGEEKGRRLALSILLAHRFGPLPPWATEQLDAASTEMMEAWLPRVLDARSLEDFFRGSEASRKRKGPTATELAEAGGRKNRMKVRQAQTEMLALLPEIESLAGRFQRIGEKLEAPQPTDEFVFGRPGRDHLRYFTAAGADLTADQLLDVLAYARKVAERSHADLLTRWEEVQKDESDGYSRFRHSRELAAVGG